MATPDDLLAVARTQHGKPYLWGGKPSASDANPPGADCSGFTNWVVQRCGLPTLGQWGGTWAAKAACQNAGTIISVAQGLATAGALLGMDYPSEQHIAFSAGNGTTEEARGKAYGIGSWPAAGRPWNWAALVPGCDYQHITAPPTPQEAHVALNAPLCHAALRPQGDGYWLLGEDFGVFTFGAAPYFGHPNDGNQDHGGSGGHPVALLPSPSGAGYTIIASDGGVFTFGDAKFFGTPQ